MTPITHNPLPELDNNTEGYASKSDRKQTTFQICRIQTEFQTCGGDDDGSDLHPHEGATTWDSPFPLLFLLLVIVKAILSPSETICIKRIWNPAPTTFASCFFNPKKSSFPLQWSFPLFVLLCYLFIYLSFKFRLHLLFLVVLCSQFGYWWKNCSRCWTMLRRRRMKNCSRCWTIPKCQFG